jgi:heptosyltransferase-1
MTHVLDRYRGDRTRVGSEYRALAEHLDLDVGPFSMEVALSRDDQAFAEKAIGEMGLEDGFAVMVPFTTRPQKHWFEDRWARVAERLEEEVGLPSVLVGGPSDHPAAERIAGLSGVEVRSVVGRTTLTQAAAMISRASLVLGVDTGLSHISVAFDRPTILIYGSNIPYTTPPSDNIKILVHWLECSPCKGNPTCDGEYTCLRLVTEDQVMGAAKAALALEGETSAEPAP